MPGLARDVGDGGVLRAVVGEGVVEAEESELVLWGKPVAESGGVCVGEVRPCVECSAAEAVESAGGVAAGGDAEADRFLEDGLWPAALEGEWEEG